ncbi:hypothetical protein C8Q74DRAFT_1443164 [Fomes fomentarius]|nr:hypothetical protein C8Q74DRAFT_1443164 [Fomes fomentarius]
MSTAICNIILHVAGDMPLSPAMAPSPFTPALAFGSPLLPASPVIVCLSDLLSGPAEFPSNASLLPAHTFLQPPGGICRRRKTKERKWYRGSRLHPAWTKIPGDAPDEFILVPVEFPELRIEDRGRGLNERLVWFYEFVAVVATEFALAPGLMWNLIYVILHALVVLSIVFLIVFSPPRLLPRPRAAQTR